MPNKRDTKNYLSLPYNPALKQRAIELRKAANLSEAIMWTQLKKKQLNGYDFDRQKIIGNFIVDFYCSNYQVVIEIDGSSHDDKVEYDMEREQYLTGLGLTVIHIRTSEVLTRIESVMKMLQNHPAFQAKAVVK